MASSRNATVRTVAERAGVAVSSVSRVLSDHPDVSEGMRAKVMKAVEELGYEPDLLARGLREGVTRTIGFVVSDISNPLFADIASGAEIALRASGYSMLLTNSEAEPEGDVSHIQLLSRRRVDGLLLSLASEDDPETIRGLRESQIPYVLIDRELADGSGSAVLSDHRRGMRDAVSMLLSLGHRRIGLVLGPPLRFTRERMAGVEEAYREAGLEPDLIVREGRLDEMHGSSSVSAMLDDERPATAIMTAGNQLLGGALGEIRSRGLSLPDDISLISCDDVPLARLMQPPIAVVRRDTRQLGRTAAELLLGQLTENEPSRSVILPTEFVARDSIGVPPISRSGSRR
jgi:LacI family transcriptional regulator, galactose operon repressor